MAVKEIAETWFVRLARRSLLTRAFLISAFLLVLLFASALITFLLAGEMVLPSLFAAFSACWVAGLLSLLCDGLWRGPNAMLFQLASGMAIRMAVLLCACALVATQFEQLIGMEFAVCLLVFYMAGLAIETAMLVCRAPAVANRK